jgi:hypothetical protein
MLLTFDIFLRIPMEANPISRQEPEGILEMESFSPKIHVKVSVEFSDPPGKPHKLTIY